MANTKVTGDLLADGTLFARHLNESHGITTSVIGEGTNLFYTDTRVGTYLGTYLPANGYDTATNIIASIVDSAPVTLDTLNELAAALGDDPNFATTVTTAIAAKIDGTGTASYLMKWSDSNTAASSVIYDDGYNVGIGVTPSAWSTSFKVIQIGGQGSIWANGSGDDIQIGANAFYDGTNYRYIQSDFSSRYLQYDGNHIWSIAPSGTAGNAISFTQAMTLNASGNLSIGNTNNTYKLDVTGEGRFYQSATTSTAYLRVENNRARNAALRLTTTVGDYYLGVGIGADVNQFQIYDGNAGVNRLVISSTGAAIFSSSVTTGSNVVLPSGYEVSWGNGNTSILGNTASGYLDFRTSNGTKLYINSSGNVGIGALSPNSKLGIEDTVDRVMNTSGTGQFEIQGNGYTFGIAMGAATTALYHNSSSRNLSFGTNETERLTITGSGNVGIGTTSPGQKLDVNGFVRAQRLYSSTNYFGFFPNYGNTVTWEIGSDQAYPGIYFYNGSGGYVFRMTVAGSATFVGGVTSDVRTKENIQVIEDNAIDFINELKPVSYEFIGDVNKKTRRGFIAQDVLETSIPSLVLGNGEEEGGTYGLDYDGILALAVKAIQELKAENNALRARIETLEQA